MTLTGPVRRRSSLLLVLLSAVVLALLAPPAVSFAAPTDDEGGTAELRKKLDEASRGYVEAKNKLDASKTRQTKLVADLAALEQRNVELTARVGEIAAAAYRGRRAGTVAGLLNSSSPQAFLENAVTIEYLTRHEDREVRELRKTRDELTAQKAQIDVEVKTQEQQLAEMAKRKRDAERALIAAGGGATVAGVRTTSATAVPARRNPDGSWPPESCSVDDPTTSGCLTPRTLHAYQQARAAGFTRYTACFRSGGSGEHPKGRACDFAAQASGFGGVAYGGDKTYGDNLAAYFVANANRLAVMYVIWYKRIWLPSSGWRSYSGDGSPAGDHTNHVHLSVL